MKQYKFTKITGSEFEFVKQNTELTGENIYSFDGGYAVITKNDFNNCFHCLLISNNKSVLSIFRSLTIKKIMR